MTEINNIPKHWQVKKLGEVCKLKNGFAFKSTYYKVKGVPVIRISDINDGIVSSNKAVRVIANDEYESYLVENNDILVAMSGATTGKFGIYKSSEKAYQNQRVGKFKILNESILDNQFLFHQINSLKRQIEKDAYGGAQPNISSNKIEQMTVAIPPLPEQQLIVSKMEELLSDLENGKQQLLLAQQQLKVYRQSLLKWAFEGKLTNKNVKEGELPKGWKWVKLGDIMLSVKNGYGKKPDDSGDIKILRISSVRPNSVNLSDVRYLKDNLYIDFEVFENDLLFTRYNGSKDYVGVCGRVPVLHEKIFYPDKLIRCRPIIKEHFHSKYIQFASNCGFARKFILNKLKTTAGQTGIAGSEIKQIPIPIAPLAEQQLIVDELESKLTVCDKIEETISQSLLQAETLKQSILKKAFEGKLV